jgi:hypothetical protein
MSQPPPCLDLADLVVAMTRTTGVLTSWVALLVSLASHGQPTPAPRPDWRETYAYTVGMQAVIYGYPVVRNTIARYGMVERPAGQVDSPVAGWYHTRRPADASDKYGSSVTENLLYSVAWFDVADEPLVISVPAAGQRYYSIQMMEMYSDIFGYVGLRATGNQAGTYLVVGPDWQGATPKGVAGVYRSPTPKGLLLLRIVYDDRDELGPTHALQDQTMLTPLSNWLAREPFVASVRDVLDPVPPKSDPLWFFRTLNRGMSENPPPTKDAPIVATLATVGLGPRRSDDFSALDPATRRGLERASVDGLALLAEAAKSGGNAKIVNHWAYGQLDWGRTAASNDFLTRAANQSYSGMQEHHVEEVVKLRAHYDAEGQLLDGTDGRYVLRFGRDQIPEARSFWSVTLYDDHYDLAANGIERYSLGSPDKDMVYGQDGSLEIYIQAEPPSQDRRANWLPAPRGPFNLFLRAYLPGADLINQAYVPPSVVRVP